MLIIGEKINILNPKVYRAIQDKDDKVLRSLARIQVEAGAQALDINLGPGRKVAQLLPWVVETVQDEVDVPLFLFSNIVNIPDGLKVHKGRPTINAVTCDPFILPRAMSAAKCFDANLVVLLLKKGFKPYRLDEYLLLAEWVLETAEENEFPLRRLFLDPVLISHIDPFAWELTSTNTDFTPVLEAVRWIPKLRLEQIKTICAISNVSIGFLPGQRTKIHQRLICQLIKAGLSAAIVNPLDKPLMATIKNMSVTNNSLTVQFCNINQDFQDIKYIS